MSDKKPVNLTARQQNLLAQLMEKLGPTVALLTRPDADDEDANDAVDRAGNAVLEWIDAMKVTRQDVGGIYDVMHRTGHNL